MALENMTVRTILLAALAAMAFAPAHATPNTPARVKAFSKLPNWSGMWIENANESGVNGHYQNEEKEVGAFKFLGHPPYKPDWEAAYQKRLADAGKTPMKGCIIDFPATMESPQPFELIVTPEETVYTAGDGTFRHIYTDGRRHLHGDDLWPTITGDSIGHWEGQTLVVDTIARSPGPDRFLGVVAYSAQAHFIERIRMTGKDTLEDQMTIEDPTAFTRPWKVTLGYKRVTYINHFDPYYCELNDRIEIKNGQETIIPAQ